MYIHISFSVCLFQAIQPSNQASSYMLGKVSGATFHILVFFIYFLAFLVVQYITTTKNEKEEKHFPCNIMNSISIKTNSLDETESEADAKEKKKPLRMSTIIMMIMIPILCIVVFWMFSSIVVGSFSSKEDASREANKRQATIQLTDK